MEKDIEKWVGDQVKKAGGLWLKFTSPGNAGVPDRIMVYMGRTDYIEFKDDYGCLSKLQEAQIRNLREHGATTHVIYGMKGAEEFWAWMSQVMESSYRCNIFTEHWGNRGRRKKNDRAQKETGNNE